MSLAKSRCTDGREASANGFSPVELYARLGWSSYLQPLRSGLDAGTNLCFDGFGLGGEEGNGCLGVGVVVDRCVGALGCGAAGAWVRRGRRHTPHPTNMLLNRLKWYR